MNAILYFHGKNGTADEANYYKKFFPADKVIGVDYKKNTPQETKIEFQDFYEEVAKNFDKIFVISNSIGAYFVMNALAEKNIASAFFISPIVDLEKIIKNMMKICGVSEKNLEEKKIIPTNFGENLSWEYFSYVKNNPLNWQTPTEILFGENDNLTSLETIKNFAEKNNFSLTVMKNGEHFFHTDEQMNFLDNWLKKCLENFL